jgi:hypothetical protein
VGLVFLVPETVVYGQGDFISLLKISVRFPGLNKNP